MFEDWGYGRLPVCVAKTQYSFSADPKALGAPDDHVLPVREARLSAGAGFVVAITGAVMTMPGLPRRPAALGTSASTPTVKSSACSKAERAGRRCRRMLA